MRVWLAVLIFILVCVCYDLIHGEILMRISLGRGRSWCLGIAAASAFGSVSAVAEDAPTNTQLFEMIKSLQAQQAL